MKKQPLLNTYINNMDMQETIHAIESMIECKKKSYIVALNVDVVMKIEHDTRVKVKVSGSDLVPELCELAAKKGYTIFIIGGKEGIAEKAKSNLENKYSEIKIVGTYAPPFGFENDTRELEKINKVISRVHPDLLIACFGCPKQEKWIYDNYMRYDATVSVCAGATVDFLAENVRRSPKWMSEHGLEWFYRFLKEPKYKK